MDKNNHFPFDLLSASVEEKKKYFVECTINHPKLNKAFLKVMEKVNESPDGKVFLVYGPTGVGKSTLCKKVHNEIILRYLENAGSSKEEIPVVMLELASPDNGKFNWKDFYRRLLKEMQEPLIDKKISLKSVEKRRMPNYLPSTSPELRESLENAIYHRKTRIILLDEAQHLLKVASAKGIQDQMDALKSIANITGSIFFMFGTYDLMEFINLNGQLGRRTDEIHFPRYNAIDEEDQVIFKNIINTFQYHLPLDGEINILQYWEFLYERSIGCIGILKEWLDDCLKDVLNNNAQFSLQILEKHAPSPSKALKIAEETINGEENIKRQGENLYLLREKLGLRSMPNKLKSEEGNEKKSKRKKKDVGKRNPTRDEIGITENGALGKTTKIGGD